MEVAGERIGSRLLHILQAPDELAVVGLRCRAACLIRLSSLNPGSIPSFVKMPPKKRKEPTQKTKLEDVTKTQVVTKKSRGKVNAGGQELCKARVSLCVLLVDERRAMQAEPTAVQVGGPSSPGAGYRAPLMIPRNYCSRVQAASREELFRRRQAAKTGKEYKAEQPATESTSASEQQEGKAASMDPVKINRAPVLTLWATLVAQARPALADSPGKLQRHLTCGCRSVRASAGKQL